MALAETRIRDFSAEIGINPSWLASACINHILNRLERGDIELVIDFQSTTKPKS